LALAARVGCSAGIAAALFPAMMRALRRVFDLFLSALCLWAAWYHTPPGALARTAVARVSGTRASVRPLLSYYGAGARTGQAVRVALAAPTLTLATAYALAWPLPESAQVTSPFGLRAHPLLRKRRLHTGIDFGIPPGTAVHAVAEGVVRRSSDDAVSGKLVLL